jgi:dimethylargininase
MRVAITRGVSPAIAKCELTHIERCEIDLDKIRAQHEHYVELLRGAGCHMVNLPVEPDLPDSMFVEDIAVVVDEVAVLMRPGAASRAGETSAVAAALKQYRPLAKIDPPGTIDGGDVLRIGRTFYVGMSTRTNRDGAAQLRNIVSPFGYRVLEVDVSGCLHLKSAVTQCAENSVLMNTQRVEAKHFAGMQIIEVDPSEPEAANCLLECGTLFFPAAFPLTRVRLENAGLRCHTLDVSEIAKAEGALTCCSITFNAT